MNQRIIFFIILVLISSGCRGSSSIYNEFISEKSSHLNSEEFQAIDIEIVDEENVEEYGEKGSANKFPYFNIYSEKGSRQNHFVPSGFMPDGKCVSFEDAWTENCHGGQTCIKVEYDLECSRNGPKWAGVYWLSPANNWGQRKGGYNLTGAQKLTFWAKGEKGGEQIQEFTTGGISGNYPDSDTAVIGPVILSKEWRKYTIDLRGKDLSYISGGFAWTTSENVNQDECVFYLDDVRFE